MNQKNNHQYYKNLVCELCKLPIETEWLEFKHNNYNPDEIGEYISCLANSAVLCRKNHAYIIWGIDDKTHQIIGTNFRPSQTKIGNEELETWLLRLLTPRIYFAFFELTIENQPVVLMEINQAFRQPVQFKQQEFIRIGSYKKKLKEFPFLDSPPRSRNEGLASFMRRIGICEERGSGIDKVVFQTEFYQLPAPIFEVTGDHTRCILFGHNFFYSN